MDHQNIVHGSVNGDRFRAQKMMKEGYTEAPPTLLLFSKVPCVSRFTGHTSICCSRTQKLRLPVLLLSVS
jgi:hypothetical protein